MFLLKESCCVSGSVSYLCLSHVPCWGLSTGGRNVYFWIRFILCNWLPFPEPLSSCVGSSVQPDQLKCCWTVSIWAFKQAFNWAKLTRLKKEKSTFLLPKSSGAQCNKQHVLQALRYSTRSLLWPLLKRTKKNGTERLKPKFAKGATDLGAAEAAFFALWYHWHQELFSI